MPKQTVLVALHYQNEVLHPKGRIKVGVADNASNRDEVIENAIRLLNGARAAGVPVVSVRIAFRPDHADVLQNCPIFRNVVKLGAMVEGSWGTEFHEGLAPLPGEFAVTHSRVGAFFGSKLEEVLRVLDARRLIMVGVSTNSVVLTSVGQAADMGYEVTVAADACSAGQPHLHTAALEIMSLVAEVKSADAVLRGWRVRSGKGPG